MRKSCSCKFLIGIETERDVVTKLTRAFQSQTEMKAEVKFYKKNGMDALFNGLSSLPYRFIHMKPRQLDWLVIFQNDCPIPQFSK